MAPTAPYRPLKIAPRSRELSTASDSPNTSSKSSESPGPISGTHGGGSRSRGSQTVVACMACRKRKSKCSRERPRCSTCWSKRTECVYETEEGQTRLEHLRNINNNLRSQVDDMTVIFHFLQSGSYEEATEVLHRLRSSPTVQDTARSIRDSQLILPSHRNNNTYNGIGRSSSEISDQMTGITKEDSVESTNSFGSTGSNGGSALASSASSMTDSSLLHSSVPPSKFQQTSPSAPTNIKLPSFASLTASHDIPRPSIHHTPSPQQSQHVLLPPLQSSADTGPQMNIDQ